MLSDTHASRPVPDITSNAQNCNYANTSEKAAKIQELKNARKAKFA